MSIGALGKVHADGDVIVRKGETGKCMFIVQQGNVDVVVDSEGGEITLARLGPGDTFGEMTLFTKSPRSATVRAAGEARVLTVDKRQFLKRIHQDPSLAFLIMRKLCERIEALNGEVIRLTDRRSPASA